MTEKNETELEKLFELSRASEDLLTVATTVDTGLEWQAVDECKQKISPNLRVGKDRGKIYFNVTLEDFPKVEQLRSVDNIYIVADFRHFEYDPKNAETNLQLLKDSVESSAQMEKCLNAWKKFTRFPGRMFPTLEEYENFVEIYKSEKEENKDAIKEIRQGEKKRGCDPSQAKTDGILSYRVTCERSGDHTFQSSQVATAIGGELQDLYHWIVDLTSYQLEILCKVNKSEMILQLRVTRQSMHRRNIAHFGPTTLRATVAYNLLSLAQPKVGDIVIDPMCGGGSIPIEGAMAFPTSYILAGDNHDKAMERTRMNFEALEKTYKSDLMQWSVSNLPFRDSYVDAFVTDMPFGKRSGSMSDNRVLYKQYLLELGRVVKVKHGRLVLLTYDRRSISIALQATKELFKVTKMLGVNMGGLHAAAYVLKRTNLTYEQFKPSLTKSMKTSGTTKKAPSTDQISL